jgi:hypothetical protein
LSEVKSPSDRPKFQDYHGLRGVSYPKRLVDTVPGYPDDPVEIVHDQGHTVAQAAGDFAIHEEVLQLLLAVEPERPETVPGAPIPDGKRAGHPDHR